MLGGGNECWRQKWKFLLSFISANSYLIPRGILKMFLSDHFMWRFCMLMLWLTRSLPCALALGWINSWAIHVSITLLERCHVRILASNFFKNFSLALLYVIPPYKNTSFLVSSRIFFIPSFGITCPILVTSFAWKLQSQVLVESCRISLSVKAYIFYLN